MGMHDPQTSRSNSFCAHTILTADGMIVENAIEDIRFSDNPDVTGGLFIRFYAGAPIISDAGYALGTICVLDQQPRKIEPDQLKALHTIAAQISKLLELKLKNEQLRSTAEELFLLEKKLRQQTLIQHENEKDFIGRELHEHLAQDLAAIKMLLDCTEKDNGPNSFFVQKGREKIGDLIDKFRNLSNSIVPSTLKGSQLLDLLGTLQAQYPHIKINLDYKDSKEFLLPENITVALFRMAQDQMKNIVKHANAHNVFIDVTIGKEIILMIEDDGTGFHTKDIVIGTGLSHIISRTELFKGTVDIISEINKGSALTITLPASEYARQAWAGEIS
jgi:signal transduction histidine kinase